MLCLALGVPLFFGALGMAQLRPPARQLLFVCTLLS